jgi:NadR type nicotinamide-nucleotide adenylyltransferase
MEKIYKIAITGAESSGKTTLAKQLAAHYQTCYVQEYAREYLENIGKNYQEKDVWEIAKIQLKREKEIENQANRFLILDTDITVLKIWLEVKFGRLPNWFANTYLTHQYDFYLLCKPDLAWEYDELREHPYMRDLLHSLYKSELKKKQVPFAIISGSGESRFEIAKESIDRHFFGK